MSLSPLPLRALRGLVVAALALAVVPLAHCSDDSLQATPSTGTIGPGGGALASSDYVFEILVPAGALTTDVTFTITPVSTPSASANGAAAFAPSYAVASDGPTTFAIPAVFSFTEQAISASSFNDPTDYRVAAFGTSDWVPLANPSIDTLANTVEGTATALSANAYSVVVPVGGTCVTVTESCAGDDAGCSPTCAPFLPGKCAAYAGAVANSCEVTDAATGISVSCCYPPTQPICFTQSEPDGCESPCSQLPGSTALSCVPAVGPPLDNALDGLPQSTCCFPPGAPVCMASHVTGTPAPRCGGANPCAALAGTIASSCLDVSDGIEAMCCLPVGTLPSSVPTGVTAGDAGVATVAGDAGGDANGGTGTDASAGTDANGGGDAGVGGDASGGDASGADAGMDSGEDAGD